MARDTLSKIVQSLGPKYFPYVLKELRISLRRGYQVSMWFFLKEMNLIWYVSMWFFAQLNYADVLHYVEYTIQKKKLIRYF